MTRGVQELLEQRGGDPAARPPPSRRRSPCWRPPLSAMAAQVPAVKAVAPAAPAAEPTVAYPPLASVPLAATAPAPDAIPTTSASTATSSTLPLATSVATSCGVHENMRGADTPTGSTLKASVHAAADHMKFVNGGATACALSTSPQAGPCPACSSTPVARSACLWGCGGVGWGVVWLGFPLVHTSECAQPRG